MLLLPIYQADIQTDPGLPSNAGIRSLRYGFSMILLSVTDQLNVVIQLKMTWKDINDWRVHCQESTGTIKMEQGLSR